MLVESFAIAKVLAPGPAPALADRLADAIARQRRLAAADDSEGFVAVDREFHTVFVTAAGNPIVTGLYDTLRDRQQRMSAPPSCATSGASPPSWWSARRSRARSETGTPSAPRASSAGTCSRRWSCCGAGSPRPGVSPPRPEGSLDDLAIGPG